ncbi:hypothetical protein F383_35902 [Gossypium arboreum]|uniref:Uncharacterized protein n=1 Tax=Gossypium arboreum TaxID=29729 RepID=A0A0B0PWU3_GOSAR|nr:hypothetical protein F383_35902 [Gossypium arboreum]
MGCSGPFGFGLDIWVLGPKIGLQQLPLFVHCCVTGIEQRYKERPILPSLAES